jgi:hypothetical protein
MSVDALGILAFKVADAQFDLASGQSYISLRDQAVRVRTLLSALAQARLLSSADDPVRVLVVGAGYAGVSAALWLMNRSVPTTLIDVNPRPFHVQRMCRTRYLSLTQYDWPAWYRSHHDYPSGLAPDYIAYPWLQATLGADCLLTDGIRRACDHADDWENQFMRRLPHPNLDWRPETRIRPSSVQGSQGGVSLVLENVSRGTAQTEWFDYVLYATGFGTDSTAIQSSTGGAVQTPGFWSRDRLAAPHGPPPRILISGGGDGSLQDFIRSIVRPNLSTANSVLEQIVATMYNQHLSHIGAVGATWAEAFQMVGFAELQASNAATWVGNQEPLVWTELHRSHKAAATHIGRTWSEMLFRAIRDVVNRHAPAREIVLVLPQAVPGKVYALNRFLFILLLEYFEYVNGKARTFFSQRPIVPPGTQRLPSVCVLRQRELDVSACIYDVNSREYLARVRRSRTPIRVDELIVRHGTSAPPEHTVRVGIHRVGLELGRIRLPFAAVK